MKKSAKPILASFIISVIVLAIFLLVYVGIKLKYEVMTREKADIEVKINFKKDSITYLTADKQKYSDADRIIPAAYNLNLIKDTLINNELYVDTSKINRIAQEINKKYE